MAAAEEPVPPQKKMRTEGQASKAADGIAAADAGAGAAAAPTTAAAAAAAAGSGSGSDGLLVVPAATGEQIEAAAVLPALQQLLAVYKVEYWAMMEELRARRAEFCAARKAAGLACAPADADDDADDEDAAAAAVQKLAGASGGSLRDLLAAVQPPPPPPQEQQQQQQQQQTADGAAAGTSGAPAAAAARAPAAEGGSAGTSAAPPPAAEAAAGKPDGAAAPAAAAAAGAAGATATDGAPPPPPQEQQQEQQQPTPPAPPAPPPFVSRYGDERCGYGAGDEQPPPPAAVEELLLRLPPGADKAPPAGAELAAWRARFAAAAPSVAELERLASAASLQYMDTQGGLACLCGEHGRWLVRRTALTLGRSTDSRGDVDVDLSRGAGGADAAAGVSRLQAQLALGLDGGWSITNTGRAPLVVDGDAVPRGAAAPLGHLSLLEVGGVPLLFMVNGLAAQRAVARSTHLVL